MKLEDVKLGDELMLFYGGESIGGATNHTLTVSPEYTDVACKDAGITGWKKLKKVGWEVTAENLYIESEYVALLTNVIGDGTSGSEDQEFEICFGSSDWSSDGLASDATGWSQSGTFKYYGKVKISSLTLNAQSGENATYSVTFTGVSKLSTSSAG